MQQRLRPYDFNSACMRIQNFSTNILSLQMLQTKTLSSNIQLIWCIGVTENKWSLRWDRSEPFRFRNISEWDPGGFQVVYHQKKLEEFSEKLIEEIIISKNKIEEEIFQKFNEDN